MDDETEPSADEIEPAPVVRRRTMRASDVVAGAALGGLLTFVAIVAVIVAARRDATPALTAEALETAREHWRKNGPPDYQMDVMVMGRQPGRYHVEVRAGKPTEVLRNDRQVGRRNWPYWTVPGLFEIIEHDMDCAADPTRGFGAKPGSKAVLRAEFDPRHGLPRKFERLILGEPDLDMTWQVTPFEDQIGGAN